MNFITFYKSRTEDPKKRHVPILSKSFGFDIKTWRAQQKGLRFIVNLFCNTSKFFGVQMVVFHITLSLPSAWAAAPSLRRVTKIPESPGMWRLSLPPLIWKPRPVLPLFNVISTISTSEDIIWKKIKIAGSSLKITRNVIFAQMISRVFWACLLSCAVEISYQNEIILNKFLRTNFN